jgi:hypothetical protein
MSTSLFSIQLIGGPADGLHVATNHVPERTLRSSKDQVDPSNATLAQYDLTDSRYGVDARGFPTIEMKYEFAGATESSDGCLTLGTASRVVPSRIERLASWAISCRRGLSAWMMAPIGYPMQIPRPR